MDNSLIEECMDIQFKERKTKNSIKKKTENKKLFKEKSIFVKMKDCFNFFGGKTVDEKVLSNTLGWFRFFI